MGTLYVVATPIGNLEDMSPRAVRTLHEAGLIAAEDTRHSRRLLTHFSISTPLISYHEHNARERRERLLSALQDRDVALITDAGTPAISDPGTDLVAAAIAAGHRVVPIPGPSSLTAAVSVSGLIDGPFTMLGFLPRESAARKTTIARAAASGWPMVMFEAANRLDGTIADLASALGERRAVVCRELTKMYEEIRAGTLRDLQAWAAEAPLRGEAVLVVSGAEPMAATDAEAESVVRMLRRSGLSASKAAREAATITGLPRSMLYELASAIEPTESVGLEGEFPVPDEHTLQNPFGNEKGPE